MKQMSTDFSKWYFFQKMFYAYIKSNFKSLPDRNALIVNRAWGGLGSPALSCESVDESDSRKSSLEIGEFGLNKKNCIR